MRAIKTVLGALVLLSSGGAAQADETKQTEVPWTDQAATMSFSSKPAGGTVNGKSCSISQSSFDGRVLSLNSKAQKGSNPLHLQGTSVQVMLGTPDVQGKTITVEEGKVEGWPKPVKVTLVSSGPKHGIAAFSYKPSTGIGMRLHFGQVGKNGLLPGYINLRCPDKSELSGYFYATIKKAVKENPAYNTPVQNRAKISAKPVRSEVRSSTGTPFMPAQKPLSSWGKSSSN